MRLSDIKDDIKRTKCEKCDYLNNSVPVDKKRTNCIGMDNMLGCEVFMATKKLSNRIDYIAGRIGPLFVCKIHKDYGGE